MADRGRCSVAACAWRCDYERARYLVTHQLSVLIGIAWVAAKWASTNTDLKPPAGDWEFYAHQLDKVIGFNLDVFEHTSEWRGRPLIVRYEGDPPLPTYPNACDDAGEAA